ncbi:MAG TPA: type II CAAX endopeptidase family protein [Planctomycetota bacterium]|nr:type II CAAX endopeptidase family protein [Planctomycetota bacterium]
MNAGRLADAPQTLPPAPGTLKVIWILAGVGMRRIWNRMQGNLLKSFARKSKKGAQPEPTRAATPRKKGLSILMLLFFGVIFMFNGVNLSTMLLWRLAAKVESSTLPPGHAAVSANVISHLENIDEAMREKHTTAAQKQRFMAQARPALREAFEHDAARHALRSSKEQAGYADRMMELYDKHGSAAFHQSKIARNVPLPGPELWAGPQMMLPLGTLLIILVITLTTMSMGTANQDLGKVEWRTEWLFTFPAPARVIFLSQIFEFALVNPLNWFIAFPFFVIIYACAGLGWSSIALGVLMAFYLGIMIGSLRTIIETQLRTSFSMSGVKNAQASFTLISLLLFFCIVGATAAPWLIEYLWQASLPRGALFNPYSAPVLLCGENAWPAVAAMAVYCIAVPGLTVQYCQWLVRDGLLSTSGVYTGSREKSPAKEVASESWLTGWFSGAARKDLLLLFRDRNFLVQTLLVPVLILAFNLMMNPELLPGVMSNYHHAASLAFGLGAYVYMFSAFNVLAVEGQGLWMLYTFPRSIERTLLQKVSLWMLFAFVYAAIVLAYCATQQPFLDLEAIGDIVLVFCGLGIYAFIAAGIGVLGTDPFELEAHRKMRPEMVYLYMLLAAMFTYGIYSDSAWSKLTLLILCSGLAYALWQKVRDHAPYLLDPIEEPPPQIALADGLMATLAFFVLQGLVMLVMAKVGTSLPLGTQLLFAFAGAGLFVALFTLYLFWRMKVPHLLATVGFRRGPEKKGSWGAAIVWGVLLGMVAAGVAAIYLRGIEGLEAYKTAREQLDMAVDDSLKAWIAITAVCAAPLCEEYIFRGLIFRGLRRSMPALSAILMSAAIFAIVHPPLGVVPVFVMGALAGFAFERTGLLLAPILAHGVYNYIVVTYLQ